MFWFPILIFCSLKVPVIGIMGSGGGFRAACGLSGVMIALEESGIFDCSTYLTGLSGSSWYVDNHWCKQAWTTGPFYVYMGWEVVWLWTSEGV